MPIRFNWMEAQEDIILVVIEGNWDWEEFFIRHKEYLALAASIERRVDYIFDFSPARLVIPEGVFKAVQELSKQAQTLKNWGVTTFVFPSALFRTVIATFSKLYPSLASRYRIAQSIDDAIAIIAKERLAAEKGKQ